MTNGTGQARRAKRPFRQLRRVNVIRTSAPANEPLNRIVGALQIHRSRRPIQDAVLIWALDLAEAALNEAGPEAAWVQIDAVESGEFEEDDRPGTGAMEPGA